ncbi:MAG: NAD(P)H-binding protein, partial [Acidimicrobiia bacterium]
MRIAVTGATGYIGGRLVPQLLAAGHEVICLARSPAKLADRPWIDDVTVKTADVTKPDGLADGLDQCDVVYYLIHSMGSGTGFEDADHAAALRFAEAARSAGVQRIIYLGGLGEQDSDLSPHLSSRHDVGVALASSGLPVT